MNNPSEMSNEELVDELIDARLGITLPANMRPTGDDDPRVHFVARKTELMRRLNRAEGLEGRVLKQIEANIDDEYDTPEMDPDCRDAAQDIKERIRWAFDPTCPHNTPIAQFGQRGAG